MFIKRYLAWMTASPPSTTGNSANLPCDKQIINYARRQELCRVHAQVGYRLRKRVLLEYIDLLSNPDRFLHPFNALTSKPIWTCKSGNYRYFALTARDREEVQRMTEPGNQDYWKVFGLLGCFVYLRHLLSLRE